MFVYVLCGSEYEYLYVKIWAVQRMRVGVRWYKNINKMLESGKMTWLGIEPRFLQPQCRVLTPRRSSRVLSNPRLVTPHPVVYLSPGYNTQSRQQIIQYTTAFSHTKYTSSKPTTHTYNINTHTHTYILSSTYHPSLNISTNKTNSSSQKYSNYSLG